MFNLDLSNYFLTQTSKPSLSTNIYHSRVPGYKADALENTLLPDERATTYTRDSRYEDGVDEKR